MRIMKKLRVDIYAMQDCMPCSCSTEPDPETGSPCVLCLEARDVVRRVRNEIPFVLNEVDITANSDLQRRYSENIPTVFINGKKSFKFRVDETEFRKKVKREIIKAGISRFRERKKENPL